MTSFYTTDAALEQYLLFHYGTPEQISPLLPEARLACGFPARCVSESLQHIELSQRGRALDLGCAVGRSSLELARTFREVIGIDFSERFIAAAEAMRATRRAVIRVCREGAQFDEVEVALPADFTPEGEVSFEVGDACNLRSGLGVFDLVLMANLIDRLPDPERCLRRLSEFIRPGGWLIITSPYTWLEEYTPREKWLERTGQGTLQTMQEILAPSYDLIRTMDLPFLIREHLRKYQWSVAQVSLWRRR